MTEAFTVTYEGPALEGHRMAARDLADALIGFADAVDGVGAVVAPEQRVRFDIHATRAGSFNVDLIVELLERGADGTLDVLNSRTAVAMATGSTIVLTTIGVMKFLLRRLRLGPPVTVESSSDGDAVRISFTDGTVLTIPQASWDAAQTPRIVAGLARAARPLRSGSVDELRVTGSGDEVQVAAEQAMAFVVEAEQSEPDDSLHTVLLEVVGPTFRDGAKWRFDDGAGAFWAAIEDRAFLARIESASEQFAKGDRIRARIRYRQLDGGGRLKVTRTVVEVLEHISGRREKQPTLDFNPQGDD